MSVAVIGSGLAGMSAAATLVERGVRPVVLDIAKGLDLDRAEAVRRLAQSTPSSWDEADREFLFSNKTLRDGSRKPRKLAFGSDYFYGRPDRRLRVEAIGAAPPFSQAEGGFSVGWSASVLPPDDVDLAAWDIKSDALAPYFRRVLGDLPYSGREDGLSQHFPLLHDNPAPLQLTRGNEVLLGDLARGTASSPRHQVAFGQARVLTRSTACQYCGECLSGCVYGAIHTAAHTLESLKRSNRIDHEKGVHVDYLQQESGQVRVFATNAAGARVNFAFDRVFLAAGAVSTTALVLRSKALYDHDARLLSTGSFIIPLARRRRAPTSWPYANTQPGVFLEFKVDRLSPHWVHSQLSTPNELVLEMLDIKKQDIGRLGRLKKRLLEYIVLAHCNVHSDHANAYVLRLKKDGDGDILRTRVEDRRDVQFARRLILRRLIGLMASCGYYTLSFLAQHGKRADSFHVGGSLPMAVDPKRELGTSLLGQPKGWSRVHVVDSSVFPSLPGTTIGLLAMANARRVATEVEL